MVFATNKGVFTRTAKVTVFLNGLKWVQCIPVVLFTHNRYVYVVITLKYVKKIKGAADKIGDLNGTCE